MDDARITDDAVTLHCFTCAQPSTMPACAANAVTIVAAMETARNATTSPGMRNGGRDDDDDDDDVDSISGNANSATGNNATRASFVTVAIPTAVGTAVAAAITC